MHGLVAARLGDATMALRYFEQTAAIDLADTHGAIAGGVHIAALDGSWMMAVLGFAGLSLQEDAISVNPQLPESWRSLALRIDGGQRFLEATLEAGEPMVILVADGRHELCCDQVLRLAIDAPPRLQGSEPSRRQPAVG